MKKRIIALLLALLIVIGTSPVPAFAADDGNATEETMQTICSVCNLADCTATHTQCEKCGNYDCTADHTNWCDTCKADNCGVDHGAAVNTTVCDVCGNEVCTCEPTMETTAPVDNCPYCEETTAEDGTVTHADICNTRYTVDASAHVGKTAAFSMAFGEVIYVNEQPHAGMVYDTSSDNYSLSQTSYDSDDPALVEITNWYWEISGPTLWYQVKPLEGETLPEGLTTESWILQNYTDGSGSIDTLVLTDVDVIGKTVKFYLATVALYATLTDAYYGDNRNGVDPAAFTYMMVKDLYTDGESTWYYLDAAEGETWPEAYTNYHYVNADYVTVVATCSICGRHDCECKEEEPADVLDAVSVGGISVQLTGLLPEGVSLSVQDAVVDAAVFGIADESDIVAALDIKLLNPDQTQYQPYTEEKDVKITLNAAALGLSDGTVVKLHHQHEGEITTLEPMLVVGGKITFYTDRFSMYVVESITSTTPTKEIANGSTYNMVVGDPATVFYSPGLPYEVTNYDTYYVWAVTDTNGVISYEVINTSNNLVGDNSPTTGTGDDEHHTYDARLAPWVKVTPKKMGTATLKMETWRRVHDLSDSDGSTIEKVGEESFTINVTYSTSFHIENQVAANGCLVPKGLENLTGISYTWTRSDGKQVRPEALNGNGINVSIDRGGLTNEMAYSNGVVTNGGITYTVVAKNSSGDELGRDSYKIEYGSEILNPSFEYPKNACTNWTPPWGGMYGYVTNGTPGLYWKTTTPGTAHNLGRDLEFGSANSPHGAGEAAHGSQYVELNAEGVGTLYQDLLTTPGATLNWTFSHTARSGQRDNMYIVMAASEHGRKIVDVNNIHALLIAAKTAETNAGGNKIINSGEGFAFTYDGGSYRIWNNYAESTAETAADWEMVSASYKVPEGQYLTRLFFVSDTGNETNPNTSSVGNLIDGVTAKESMGYIVEYYEYDEATNQYVFKESETKSDCTPNTGEPLTKLSTYLARYEYAADIYANGYDYPGTLDNLKNIGLYITDYGAKTADLSSYNQDIVVRIYFKAPLISVTKKVKIVNMSADEQNAILAEANGFYADFRLTDGNGTSLDAGVKITRHSTNGELMAETSFSDLNNSHFDEEFTFKETAANNIPGFTLTTTVRTTYDANRENWTEWTNLDDVKISVHNRTENGVDLRYAYVEVTNTYTRNVGNLRISKVVQSANAIDSNQEFTFTVSGNAVAAGQSYPVVYSNGTSGTLTASADAKLTLKLKHGQYADIKNLKLDTFAVTETPTQGYTTANTTLTGTITPDNKASAQFVNLHSSLTTGTLSVTKKMAEGSADTGVEFLFHVYNAKNERITSFTLKAGDTRTIVDIPYGTYTVVEDTSWNWRYTPDATSKEATISNTSKTAAVTFTNTQNKSEWLSDTAVMLNTFSYIGS